MICQYCKQDFKADAYECCSKCGAPKPKPETIHKYDPFFYGGYIVYALKDDCRRGYEFVFYRGESLCAQLKISQEAIEKNVNPYEDYMPYVMSRLEAEEQLTDG